MKVNTNSKEKSSKKQGKKRGTSVITVAKINPYIRDAEIQNAILEGKAERYAYDHRLFYVLENDGEIIIEGKAYPLHPDTVIFVPPAIGYRFCGKLNVAILNFDMTRAADTRDIAICPPIKAFFSPELVFDSTLSENFETPFILHGMGALKEDILELIRIWNEKEPLSDALTSTNLKIMLIKLISDSSSKPDKKDMTCSKIQGYIKLNVGNEINTEIIAKHFGYHPTYLGEIFKEKTGKTVYQAVIDERIRLAKRWLTETEATVEEIAYELHFSSRSHFCTSFKAHAGVTPLQYRYKNTDIR